MKGAYTGDILAQINDLATISPVVIELINKIGQKNTTRSEIARLVQNDEIIYANVFKYTSSAALALPRAPQSIDEAIDILGEHGLLNLIFIIAAKKVFLNLKSWEKSLVVAHRAKYMGEKLDYDAQALSNLYIGALMHSMGSMVLETFQSGLYQKIESININNLNDYNLITIKEKELFGISSSELSYKIGISYKLPNAINNILRTQAHNWKDAEFTQANAIILIAKLITDSECLDVRDLESALDQELLSRFDLKASLINDPELINLEKQVLELAKSKSK